MSQLKHYSDFLTTLGALVGIPSSRLTTEIAATFNALFNTAMQRAWGAGNWIDVCPRGEARFVGNRLSYPNFTGNTTYWTNTALIITANQVANPADGLVTSTKMQETAANSAHKVVQSVTTLFPSTDFAASLYIRPNGRNWVQLSVSDGDTTHSAFFNMASGGVVGTTINTNSTTIAQQPSGFWLCRMTFTASASATTSGTYSVLLSTDGAATSYAGDAAKGIYIWGNLVQQTSNVPLNDSLLPFDQAGEAEIEGVFDLWGSSPFATNNPVRLTYTIIPDGIQIINASPVAYNYYVNGVAQQSIFGAVPCNPLFLYYRKACPDFTGDEYSASATYVVDDQVFFENSAGQGDFWKCKVATIAGQNPDTTATSWELLPVYDTFYRYVTFQAYADWLISDGQMDKATGAYAIASGILDDEFDVMERQMGQILPMKVQTHLTAQSNY